MGGVRVAFKVIQNLCVATGFLLAKYVPVGYISLLTLVALVVAMVCYVVVSRRVPLDAASGPATRAASELPLQALDNGTDRPSTPPPAAAMQYGHLEEDWTDDSPAPSHSQPTSSVVAVGTERRISFERSEWTE